jgi:hydrogenase-4 component E
MNNLTSYLLALILLNDMAFLITSRMNFFTRMVALQGFLTGLLPLAAAPHSPGAAQLLTAFFIILVKGVLFPALLTRTMRVAGVSREIEPYIGFTTSAVIGVAALLVSCWICSRLQFPDEAIAAPLAPAIAVFTVLTGLFIIVTRLKAITQVAGFIVFENGIYALGSVLLFEQGFIVELGVLLDVLVVVFIMGVAISHINREFDHIDTNHLNP